jgi:signal transduction histidine kinase
MDNLTDILLGAVKQNQEKVTDVISCMNSAISMVAHQAAKAKVELCKELIPLPPVKGNALELEQVFMNVLLNSIQQIHGSRRQRGRVTIRTDYQSEDKQFPVKIRISDTGPGIHYKYLDKIFEPMFTTKEKGTGMGLYICRELLALMSGRIQVEQTTILTGTTFLVELLKA